MIVALSALAVLLGLGTLLWLASLPLRNSSIVDAAWGPLFFVIALVEYFVARPHGTRPVVVLTLVGLWSMRLAVHLAVRNGIRHEDKRYAAMRARHGERWWIVSFPLVFVLQPILAWVVALPLHAVFASNAPGDLGPLDAVASLVVLGGITTEALADGQLARFLASSDREGRVLDTGLWRYSRHPNYFGDFVVWWGFGLFGLAAHAIWSLAGPAVMSYLLLRVSGVTLLEQTIGSRRPAYAEYQKRTNAFFPGPVKNLPRP